MPNTVNSQIVYGIVPGSYSDNFTIDPNTGVLTNRGDLDRESFDSKLQGRVELNVTATDKGTPPLSSSVLVIVNIEVNSLQLTPVFHTGFLMMWPKTFFVFMNSRILMITYHNLAIPPTHSQ